MYDRLIETRAKEFLEISPVVMLTGPRRAGKTTLAKKLSGDDYDYVTLDDELDFKKATMDPVGFIREFDRVIIDEIQRTPEVFRTIKRYVDEDPRPGRFLLTGSANVILIPQMGDSLVGRMQLIRLLPLAQAEIKGNKPTFLNRLFLGEFEASKSEIVGNDLVQLVMTGGYPENIGKQEKHLEFWAESYLDLALTRDLRDIAIIEKLVNLPRLVKNLAMYSGQLINFTRIGAESGLEYHTVQRYIALLEQIYLVSTVSPWPTNLLNRVSKSPKIHFLDARLHLSASEIGLDYAKRDRDRFGHILESFVYSEILKLIPVSEMRLTPYHFRDNRKREVDLILERGDGMVAGIEVKASATIQPKDFAGLRVLSEACGEKFAHGIILYDGTRYLPYGDRLSAVPISSLWE